MTVGHPNWRINASAAALIATANLLALLLTLAVGRYTVDEVDRAREGILNSQRLLQTVTDAETGQRGFLITGDEGYLEPYERAISSLNGQLASLRSLKTGDSNQQRQIRELESLTEDKLTELAQTIRLRKISAGSADAEVSKGTGRRLMFAIRSLISRIDAQENQYLDSRIARRHLAVTWIFILCGAGTVFGIVLMIGSVREKALSERFLRERDDQFRMLADSIPQLCWMAEADGSIFWYNQRWYEYTGETPESMAGWGWQSVHDPKMLPIVMQRWKDSIKEETPFEMIFPLRQADGEFRVFLTRVAPVRNAAGKLDRWFGTNTDITEQRKVEESLRQSEERLHLAQQVALVGTFDWNIRTGVNQWTPELETMYGVKPGDFARTEPAWEQLIHPDDRDQAAQSLMQSLKTGHLEAEWRVIWPDGSVHWLYGRGSVFRDEAGTPIQMIGVNIDITERKQAEAALRESEARYSTLAEALPAIVFTTSPGGEIEYVNGRWQEYTSVPLEPCTTLLSASAIHPDERSALESDWAAAIYTDTVLDTEFRLRRADGVYRWFRCRVKPLYDREGQLIRWLGIASDTDDEKKAEERLRQSQKMEAVGRLAGGVAHDFNNLLTAITGFNGMLMEDLESDTLALAHAREVQSAADRASSLTRQLLTLSRRDMSQPKVLNLNEAVLDIRNLLGRVIGEDIEIRMTLASDLWQIFADPTHIDQVIMNLAVNARDAMPRGGRLSFRTANAIFLTGDENCPPEGPGEYLELEVSDTGCGMSAETKSRLFEPFFTTKESGKGTGLGLSIVYGVIQQNKGGISVESAPGAGASFRLHFPRWKKLSFEGGDAAEAQASVSGDVRASILVVEDDHAVRSFVVAALERDHHDVVAAATPMDAIEILRNGTQPFDLLLTDVLMPGMRGPELLDRTRELRPGIEFLYMSGYSDSTFLKADVVAGHSFLQKPFTAATLIQKVRETLARRPNPSSLRA